MNEPTEPREPHDPLAARLAERRSRIVDAWAGRVRALSPAAGLAAPVLVDHVPMLLDAMIARCRGRPASTTDVTKLHAAHRLARGFDLAEVAIELSMLARTVEEQAADGAVDLRRWAACVTAVVDEALLGAVMQPPTIEGAEGGDGHQVSLRDVSLHYSRARNASLLHARVDDDAGANSLRLAWVANATCSALTRTRSLGSLACSAPAPTALDHSFLPSADRS